MGERKLNKSEIKNIFDNFSKKKIIVIGDVMLDSYWWGSVERVSPEAPVPIVNVQSRKDRLGGAANVALNISMLEGEPLLFSVIGNDDDGNKFLNILKKGNISSDNIITINERPTTLKSRIIANNQQQLIRLDHEVNYNINDEDSKKLEKRILEKLSLADAVLFQDYDKGVLSERLITNVINRANELKIPILVDPKRRNFNFYKNATLFKPNLKELKEGLNLEITKPVSVEKLNKAAKLLSEKLNIKIAFITLSEEGVYINNGSQKIIVPSHKRRIYDVSGAGDTVISVAAMTLALGLEPEIIAELTNLAGGLVCEEVGVVPIDKEIFYNECLKLLGK